MRLKCIACDVLARPVYLAAARSSHSVDVTLQPFGLHLHPKNLLKTLQAEIDRAGASGRYDAVALAYGLCGNAASGLQATGVPLVMARAHDCVTLFLGSRERYAQEFQACPGTYWYVQDFVARSQDSSVSLSMGGMTSGDADAVYAEYIEKYGRDNADYLMEAMGDWQAHYERAAYVDTGLGEEDGAVRRAQADAQRNGWRFERLAGDLTLIRRLLDGDWDADFLVLDPGQQVHATGDEEIIAAGE
jgi:hypothetical protein